MQQTWKYQIESLDDRRDLIIPGNKSETLTFCAEHFIGVAESAMAARGTFSVALSGGSTPKAIYQLLTHPPYRTRLDWSHVQLFWSDERSVPSNDPESNFKMAMDCGFAGFPIPSQNIFRMPAESEDIEEAAREYEKIIIKHVPNGSFDLIMLGMGEDGHTASLFPKTHGLHAENRLVIANFIPSLNTWRMTLTFDCINESHEIAVYVLGKGKASMLKQVLTSDYDPDSLPAQRVGTRTHKALWIADTDAGSALT